MTAPPFLLLLFFFLFLTATEFRPSTSAPVATEFLYPTYSFNPFLFVDSSGAFLSSPNATFSAFFSNPGPPNSPNYYLYLLHNPSNSLVWSANPASPLPSAANLSLTPSSLSLSYPNGTLAWSTPSLSSPIHSLQLLDSGNLLLLNSSNSSLWQSFEQPTNTLLPNQRLLLGSSLISAVTDSDLSDGGYRLSVTDSDAVLSWRGLQQYWHLSTDPNSVKDYRAPAAYLSVNGTGLYLSDAADRIIYQVALPPTGGLRMGKLDPRGRFLVTSYVSGNGEVDFVAPSDGCSLPMACRTLEVCGSASHISTCSCPDLFGPAQGGGCLPSDGSLLPSSSPCDASSVVSYLSLGNQIGYFANRYADPIEGRDFASCESNCTKKCSCFGFFYKNSSLSCYLIQNQLGSLMQAGASNTSVGYIKILKSNASSSSPSSKSSNNSSANILPIILPLIATVLLLVLLSFVGVQWWRKKNKKRGSTARLRSPLRHGRNPSSSQDHEFSDSEEIAIPGLPTRFSYAELEVATDNFGTLIGAGGFGCVYKGELPDKSLVAVKRITNIGMQGKKEFCTEIAVIGKIHHVNLVKLRGYCAQGSNRLLVYEFMNRASLDRPLFGQGPVLEWQERLEIAIGAARGLAYLHSGCDNKILHCDIKPENILLADHGQVKIADFGMAKLISPEQSALFTTMRGTRGYLAPEWLTNSAISDKTDVYSYGMVLLEIVRGRKNRYSITGTSDSSGSSGSNVEYFPLVAVEKHLEGKWFELADPRMQGRVTETEVERVVKVALCCLHEEPWMRPTMAAVVGMLDGTMVLGQPKVEGLKFLRLYGRGSGGETGVAVAEENCTGSESSTAGASLLTYISSQEVSGPR